MTITATSTPKQETAIHSVWIDVPAEYAQHPAMFEAIALGLVAACRESVEELGWPAVGSPRLRSELVAGAGNMCRLWAECDVEVPPPVHEVTETKEGLFVKLEFNTDDIRMQNNPTANTNRLKVAKDLAATKSMTLGEAAEQIGKALTPPKVKAAIDAELDIVAPDVAHFSDDIDVANEGHDVNLDDYLEDE